MNNDIEFIKRIESFLEGSMDKEEKAIFEKQLIENAELQKELELHKKIHASLNIKGKEDLKNNLNNYYNKYKYATQRKKVIRLMAPVLSAAAAIIFVLLFFYGKENKNLPSNEILTLDSSSINKMPNYADSSNYQMVDTEDSVKIKNNQ